MSNSKVVIGHDWIADTIEKKLNKAYRERDDFVYDFIDAFYDEWNNGPTVDEIRLAIDLKYEREIGYTSRTYTMNVIGRLEQEGRIIRPVNDLGSKFRSRYLFPNGRD